MIQTNSSFDATLSVVVPVKNEAANVAPLIAEIHDALAGLRDFEVIYVDDGSDDGTAAALAAAKAEYPRLRVIRHARSCGQSTAIHSGVGRRAFPGSRRWTATGRTIRRTSGYCSRCCPRRGTRATPL